MVATGPSPSNRIVNPNVFPAPENIRCLLEDTDALVMHATDPFRDASGDLPIGTKIDSCRFQGGEVTQSTFCVAISGINYGLCMESFQIELTGNNKDIPKPVSFYLAVEAVSPEALPNYKAEIFDIDTLDYRPATSSELQLLVDSFDSLKSGLTRRVEVAFSRVEVHENNDSSGGRNRAIAQIASRAAIAIGA